MGSVAAIATGTHVAQAAEGRARHLAAKDSGDDLFSRLLAQMLQGVSGADTSSTDTTTSDPGDATDTAAVLTTSPAASVPIANSTLAPAIPVHQNTRLSARLASQTVAAQIAATSNAASTAPLAVLAQNADARSTRGASTQIADTPGAAATQAVSTPSVVDPRLAAALQSLAAQSARAANPRTAQPVTSSTPTSVASHPMRAALLQGVSTQTIASANAQTEPTFAHGAASLVATSPHHTPSTRGVGAFTAANPPTAAAAHHVVLSQTHNGQTAATANLQALPQASVAQSAAALSAAISGAMPQGISDQSTATANTPVSANSAAQNPVSLDTAQPGLAALLQSLKVEASAPDGQTLASTNAPAPHAAQPGSASTAQTNIATTIAEKPAATQAALTKAVDAAIAAQPSLQASVAAAATGIERTLFTQGAQHAVHQVAPSTVTEAKALPIHFDVGNTKPDDGSGGSSGGRSGQQNTGATPQPQGHSAGATASPPAAKTDTAPQSAQQQTVVAQNTTAPAANNTTANGVTGSAAPTQSATPTATLHVVPQNQAADQVAQPNIQALAVSIAAQSQSGARHFNIKMDPPELGRVEVRLTIDGTGKAQAHLAADKPQTLELLQRDSANLSRALKDSGVQLNNNGLQFSLKGQDRHGDGSPQSQSRGRALAVTAVAGPAVSDGSTSLSNFSTSSSGVDIRV